MHTFQEVGRKAAKQTTRNVAMGEPNQERQVLSISMAPQLTSNFTIDFVK